MKELRISTDFSVEECMKLLQINMNSVNTFHKHFVPTTFLNEEFIGKVRDNKFWIRKTMPRMFSGFHRHFIGQIIRDDNITIIKGAFRFPIYFKIVPLAVMVPFMIGALHAIRFRLFPLIMFIGFYALMIGFIYLMGHFSIVMYEKEEQEVLKLLQSLFQKGENRLVETDM